MAFAQHGVLLPATAQTQGGAQAFQGTATLAVGASAVAASLTGCAVSATLGVGAAVTGNSLVGFLVTGTLAVAGAATSGAALVENGVVISLRWYARTRRHPYTRM
jgi:hypothetical protein